MDLNLNSETVCFLIAKAHEFHAKEGVTIEESPTSPSDDWAMQVLADHSDDATYQEMAYVINDLDPDQQIELVALMWLGRGDFSLDEWDLALEQAADANTSHTAEYLIATPLVSDYWQEGLELHGYSCD
ncbi:DUF3775 domain-containing protein [Marinobacter caseinilyticus]|uniref:DUF3775 domain-containing protein n=1 Tax=Marinobacter caseinilyticus TaxID=2692195 RepID=UPI001408C304|nr:DUF3775 domain-containing protein [Marinobacter caseinilyticus]